MVLLLLAVVVIIVQLIVVSRVSRGICVDHHLALNMHVLSFIVPFRFPRVELCRDLPCDLQQYWLAGGLKWIVVEVSTGTAIKKLHFNG